MTVPLFSMCTKTEVYRCVHAPENEVLSFAMMTQVISVRDPRYMKDVKLNKAI